MWIALGSFVSGVAATLALASASSGHWASLSYVTTAYELRLDGGEAAAVNNWREVDRNFSSVLKIKGTRAERWDWYFPLVGWINLDYTQGPGPSYTTSDLAIAAFAASRSGDGIRASSLYGELEKSNPGTAKEKWEALALGSLKHFADSADIVRRGKYPGASGDGIHSPAAAQSGAP
jgi:hypothetical protein